VAKIDCKTPKEKSTRAPVDAWMLFALNFEFFYVIL